MHTEGSVLAWPIASIRNIPMAERSIVIMPIAILTIIRGIYFLRNGCMKNSYNGMKSVKTIGYASSAMACRVVQLDNPDGGGNSKWFTNTLIV